MKASKNRNLFPRSQQPMQQTAFRNNNYNYNLKLLYRSKKFIEQLDIPTTSSDSTPLLDAGLKILPPIENDQATLQMPDLNNINLNFPSLGLFNPSTAPQAAAPAHEELKTEPLKEGVEEQTAELNNGNCMMGNELERVNGCPDDHG